MYSCEIILYLFLEYGILPGFVLLPRSRGRFPFSRKLPIAALSRMKPTLISYTMKRFITLIAAMLAFMPAAFASQGELVVTPQPALVTSSITLNYDPLPQQQWMASQDVYLYVCLEMDGNGEWVKEKAEWSLCNKPEYKWIKNADGSLSYTINNLQTYFKLNAEEMGRVTGMFVILKNDKFQTTDKYVRLSQGHVSDLPKFNGTVRFSVKVPAGTRQVYVAGTFGKEGDPLYWEHAAPELQLKKVDATHFEGIIENVPANLEYLYVWGPRIDQTEFRMGHRPLGGRSSVHDIVEYWGDMTLSVNVPKGTTEVYVSGSFNNWGFSQMMDAGNNNWIYHVPPTALGGSETVEYKYYFNNAKDAGEQGGNRKVQFEGFSTQYDDVKSWK